MRCESEEPLLGLEVEVVVVTFVGIGPTRSDLRILQPLGLLVDREIAVVRLGNRDRFEMLPPGTFFKREFGQHVGDGLSVFLLKHPGVLAVLIVAAVVPVFGHLIDEEQRKHLYTLRSEEHTSELQSLMRNSYAVFCLKKNT